MQKPVITTGYAKTLYVSCFVSSIAGAIRFAGNCFSKRKPGGKIIKTTIPICMDTLFLLNFIEYSTDLL